MLVGLKVRGRVVSMKVLAWERASRRKVVRWGRWLAVVFALGDAELLPFVVDGVVVVVLVVGGRSGWDGSSSVERETMRIRLPNSAFGWSVALAMAVCVSEIGERGV